MASDILILQEYLFNGLLSCALFDRFNVVLEREFLMQNEVEFNAIWQAPRAGQSVSGIGLYVEMPKLELPKPNSLQRNLVASIGVIEERNINMTEEVGTQVSAEELAELALDFMFGWVLGFSSALTPESGGVAPAPDLALGDTEGLVKYRARVSLRREHRATARCDTPTLTDNGDGTYGLVNGSNTPDAEIFYTVGDAAAGENDFPGRANKNAVKYAAPVALSAGQKITWAAWRVDRLPSHVSTRSIT
jgi:hypothetical protein